jgi:hypothetical protein
MLSMLIELFPIPRYFLFHRADPQIEVASNTMPPLSQRILWPAFANSVLDTAGEVA